MPGEAILLMTVVPPPPADPEAETAVAATVEMWRASASALSPVIGSRGFAALYHRTVRRVAAQFDWLEAAADVHDSHDLFAPLRALLAQRSAAEVAAVSAVLRDVFRELLEHLIGAALAQRLVGAQMARTATDPKKPPTRARG